jgi:purine-binding chemotaxis protein CheW
VTTSPAESKTERLQVVCFEVGSQSFALDIMRITEVILPRQVSPLPGQPGFVEGLFELRGAFLPLIDLRRRFGLVPPSSDHEKVMVLSAHGRTFGVLVDRVTEVERLELSQLLPPPVGTMLTEVAPCRGVVHRDGAMTVVLDSDKLFSQDELELLATGEYGR